MSDKISMGIMACNFVSIYGQVEINLNESTGEVTTTIHPLPISKKKRITAPTRYPDFLQRLKIDPSLRQACESGEFILIDGILVRRSVALPIALGHFSATKLWKIENGNWRTQVRMSNPRIAKRARYPVYSREIIRKLEYEKIRQKLEAEAREEFFAILLMGSGSGGSSNGSNGGNGGNGGDGNGGGSQQSPFERMLDNLIAEKNLTNQIVSDRMGVDPRYFRRVKNDPEKRPPLNFVVAACVALHLIYYQSEQLLKVAGYALRDVYSDRIYVTILSTLYMYTVSEVNRFLISEGFEPLTKTKK